MSLRFVLGVSLSVGVAVLAVALSTQGYWQLKSLRAQVDKVHQASAVIEAENRLLKRQVDLLSKPTPALMDRVLRDHFGFVRLGELVFFEAKSSKPF